MSSPFTFSHEPEVKVTLQERVLISRLTSALYVAALLGGCGESHEEAYERGAEDGYAEGFDEGKTAGLEEAYDCVRNEGGEAEDAADSCE